MLTEFWRGPWKQWKRRGRSCGRGFLGQCAELPQWSPGFAWGWTCCARGVRRGGRKSNTKRNYLFRVWNLSTRSLATTSIHCKLEKFSSSRNNLEGPCSILEKVTETAA